MSLTLHNPSRANALTPQAFDQLQVALTQNANVRAWLIRGGPSRGDAFSSGYDLGSLESWPHDGPLPDERIGEVFDLLSNHPAPSVALIEGAAFGAGCELACACDFRVGSRNALFCLPPARLGIVYAPRGIARVARRIGEQRARLMFLTGRRVTAVQAESWGLLDVMSANAAAEALALARELQNAAPLAVAGMKRVLAGERGEAIDALRRASFQSQDANEGRAAFVEKRAPVFRGR